MTKYRYITSVISIMAMLAVCLSACSVKTAGKDAQAQKTQAVEEVQASLGETQVPEEPQVPEDEQAETAQEEAEAWLEEHGIEKEIPTTRNIVLEAEGGTLHAVG